MKKNIVKNKKHIFEECSKHPSELKVVCKKCLLTVNIGETYSNLKIPFKYVCNTCFN